MVMEEKQFNLSLREVLTFWELIYLQQDTGNDSARDLHPSLTTFLDLVFKLKSDGAFYHRPWSIRNALKYHQAPSQPTMAGALHVAAFLRECADVLEDALQPKDLT